MRRQYGATGLMQHIDIPSDIVAAGSLIRRRAAGTLVATPPTVHTPAGTAEAEWGRGNEARSHSHNRTKARRAHELLFIHDETMSQSQVRTVPFVEVALVPWPGAEERRVTLRDAGMPRLLLVPEDCDPPVTDDVLEDWVRTPADPREVQARVSTLRLRATRGLHPRLDDNGRLYVGTQWVALSPIECRLISALLDRFGSVVSRATLTRSGWPSGEPSRNQLDVHVLRLRRRVEPLGLSLRTLRARGYSLDRSTNL